MPRKAAPIAQRFWAKVRVGPPDACWPWTKGTFNTGYGQFGFPEGGKWKGRGAHKIAYELTHGPVPKGTLVCHTCDFPPCCNPAHLFAGTYQDNSDDKVAKGRQARGERSWAHQNPHLMPRGERHGSRTKPLSVVRGEACHSARLTVEQVMEIRQRRREGHTYKEIGALYGVTPQAIFRIVKRTSWKEVA